MTTTHDTTENEELNAAFADFKKSERGNIFADSIAELCDAERRRIHACSNASDAAELLAHAIPKPTPAAVFAYDNENALERFADGSLYEKSNAESSVWVCASDFRSDRIGFNEPITAGLREFFGEEEPEEPSAFRVTARRFFYGPLAQEGWMEENGEVCEFATKDEAEGAILEAEGGTYYLSHNESGCPEYIITPIE